MNQRRYWLVLLSFYSLSCYSSIYLLKAAVRLAKKQHAYFCLGHLIHTSIQAVGAQRIDSELLHDRMKAVIATNATVAQHSTTLLSSYKLFQHTPGYHNTVRCILAHANCPSGVKGHTYELATAISLQQGGEPVKALNQKITCGGHTKEFDIITHNLLVECKHTNWKSNKHKLRRQIGDQAALAQLRKEMNQEPYTYVVSSRQPIPPGWKSWLKKHNIQFEE